MKKHFTFLLAGSLLLLFQAAFGQNVTVRGIVRDASTNEALPGVSIAVRGTTSGTQTTPDGAYTLSVPANARLVFSFIGYTTQEVAVGTRTQLDVALAASASELEQVVVIGYGTATKRDLTGSITSVKGDELARLPATNPVSSLQGKVAGLTIVNSGRAGAAPTVRIRGVNSTNNSDPLYVVDGVFQTNIDYLNPADIESMEVLRDPSSIAIFGLQGGNGVIIVTTKRAARGETRVSFQSMVGVQSVQQRINLSNGAEFLKLYSAQLSNIGAAPFDATRYTANTNWQDQVLRNAIITTNNLSFSNNSEKTTTYLSFGYNLQEGVVKNDQYKKYIGRINEEIRVSNHLRIGGDITGFHWRQQDPGTDLNNALWAAPIVPVQAGEGIYYSMPSFQRAQVGNPVARINRANRTTDNQGYRAIASIFAEVKFMQHFTWRSAAYTDLGFNQGRGYTPLPYRFINLGEGTTRTDTTFDRSVRTSVSQSQAVYRKFQQDHTLTYDRTFGQVHHLTALAGFTTLYQGSTSLSGNRRDTTLNIPNNPDFWYLSIAQQSNPGTYGGGAGEEAYMSFLGRVSYSYAGRYLLNATFRRDGGSKFAPARRWGNFGSVGLGWVVSDESFFSSWKGMDFLKLRAAWGTVGNGLGIGSYVFYPVLNNANVGVFGNNVYTSVAPAYVPDPNLHWEVVRGIDVGLELRTFSNRLSADINWYDRKTNDILTTITLLGSAGNTSYFTNLGSIDNRGVELTLGWNDKLGEDFGYRLGANFSYNRNVVESIGNNIDFQILGNGGVNRTETGKSIGYFYGYRQTGIYQTTASLDKTPAFANSLPGDIAYADTNGDGRLTEADRTYLGTPFPPYNFGTSLTLNYKGFDLMLEGQGVAGNKIFIQRRTATFATLNYEANRLNAWTGAGTSNVEPILDNTRGNNFLFSSYFLEPGDYFRIRTLQLGYNIGPRTLERLGMKQLRLYVSGQNVLTFSRTTGYSPEAPIASPIAAGADNGTYPVPAVYSVGINATF